MKNNQSSSPLIRNLVCIAAAAVVLGTAGCAGDRYNRSTGQYIDDHSLQVRVDHALNSSPDYKFPDVSVVAFKGAIQLNGFVDMADQKNRANSIVQAVPGVRQVENNIMVEENRRSAGEIVDDKALASRVREMLHDNPEYKFGDVEVAVFRGNVQLSGFVDTANQKARAADLAKQVAGVRDVRNSLTVKDKMNP